MSQGRKLQDDFLFETSINIQSGGTHSVNVKTA